MIIINKLIYLITVFTQIDSIASVEIVAKMPFYQIYYFIDDHFKRSILNDLFQIIHFKRSISNDPFQTIHFEKWPQMIHFKKPLQIIPNKTMQTLNCASFTQTKPIFHSS